VFKSKFLYCFFILNILLISITSESRELSVSDIVERSSSSVVQIIAYDITGKEEGQGSGFFIAPGQIITNAHVINKR